MSDKITKTSVIIEITLKCYQGCIHCFNNSVPKGESIDFTQIKKYADEIHQFLDNNKNEFVEVWLMGGEPIVYQDEDKKIEDVVKLFLHDRVNIGMCTAGVWRKDPEEFKLRMSEVLKVDKDIIVSLGFTLYLKNPVQLMIKSSKDLIDLGINSWIFTLTYDSYNKDETVSAFENEVFPVVKEYGWDGNTKTAGEDWSVTYELVFPMGRALKNIKSGKLDRKGERTSASFGHCRLKEWGSLDIYITQDNRILPCCVAEYQYSGSPYNGNLIDLLESEREFISNLNCDLCTNDETYIHLFKGN